MGVAAKIAAEKIAHRREHLILLKDRLIKGVLDKIPDAFLTGHSVQRLPGHAVPGENGGVALNKPANEILRCEVDRCMHKTCDRQPKGGFR